MLGSYHQRVPQVPLKALGPYVPFNGHPISWAVIRTFSPERNTGFLPPRLLRFSSREISGKSLRKPVYRSWIEVREIHALRS